MGKKSRRNNRRGGGTKGSTAAPVADPACRRAVVVETSTRIFDADPRRTIAAEASRAIAGDYLSKYLSLSNDALSRECNWEKRFCHLLNFSSNLKYDSVTTYMSVKEDYKVLKLICKNPTEAALFRAHAYFAMARLKSYMMEYEDSLQCVCTALHICQEARADPQERRAWMVDGRDYLEFLQKKCERLRDGYTKKVFVDREGNEIVTKLMGGQKCDACGKKSSELGIVNDLLECCGRCQMSFYCSKECQKLHWKTHKLQCRKPGEFRVGDFAFYCGPSTPNNVRRGRVVEIRKQGKTSSKPGDETWLVSDGEKQFRTTRYGWVAAEYLRCCRPVLWNLHGKGSKKKDNEN